MCSLKRKFGLRLQEIRKLRKLTQEKLAELIGVDPPHISNIERGKYFVKAETLESLAKALNVEEKEFFEFNHFQEREKLISTINNYINDCDNSKLEFVLKMINTLQEFDVSK